MASGPEFRPLAPTQKAPYPAHVCTLCTGVGAETGGPLKLTGQPA